jgi:hypothetical protein
MLSPEYFCSNQVFGNDPEEQLVHIHIPWQDGEDKEQSNMRLPELRSLIGIRCLAIKDFLFCGFFFGGHISNISP